MKFYKQFIHVIFLFFTLLSCSIQQKLQKNTTWKIKKYDNFHLHYVENSLITNELDKIKNDLDSTIKYSKKTLEIDTFKTPIQFYIFESNQKIAEVTKEKVAGMCYYKRNLIFQNRFFCTQQHEIIHLFSQQQWKYSKLWLMEGLAVYADDKWYGKSIDLLSKNYLKTNKLIPFSKLKKNKNFKKENQAIVYVQSGSFVKFLIKTYGIEKFKLFWKSLNAEKIYDKSLIELENLWKKNLMQQ
jgi:hypothetical protein